MKKKIFAFVGVNHNNGYTATYIEKIIEKIKTKIDIDFELITLKDYPIKQCNGCLNCFQQLQCPVDVEDDFILIKNKMKEADFIIVGSPVYLHNVTGGMKTFLDRLSYWSHLFYLRGKNSMVIACSSTSGSKMVCDYLENAMNYFGSPVIIKTEVTALNDFNDGLVDSNAKKIYESLITPVKSNQFIEESFTYLKRTMLYQEKKFKELKEPRYWRDQGMFDVDTLEELLS